MSWISKDQSSGEEYVFTSKTGLRESARWGAVHTAMLNHWDQLNAGNILGGADLIATRLSNWETSGGFTGWHQISTQIQSSGGDTADRLPPQLAAVFTVLNDTDLSVALGRRRNRTFLGPLVQGFIDGAGYITSTAVSACNTAFDDFRGDLLGIPSGVSANLGICVFSVAELASMAADKRGMGPSVDTHRSRRQKRNDHIVYAAF